jgi:Uma2 family endonuclease
VLSPGADNERRDRNLKLRLYGARGVLEHWIIDRIAQTVEVYRREKATLKLVATLLANDEITSPILPEFSYPVARLFS